MRIVLGTGGIVFVFTCASTPNSFNVSVDLRVDDLRVDDLRVDDLRLGDLRLGDFVILLYKKYYYYFF